MGAQIQLGKVAVDVKELNEMDQCITRSKVVRKIHIEHGDKIKEFFLYKLSYLNRFSIY